jgi:hypothetical protein
MILRTTVKHATVKVLFLQECVHCTAASYPTRVHQDKQEYHRILQMLWPSSHRHRSFKFGHAWRHRGRDIQRTYYLAPNFPISPKQDACLYWEIIKASCLSGVQFPSSPTHETCLLCSAISSSILQVCLAPLIGRLSGAWHQTQKSCLCYLRITKLVSLYGRQYHFSRLSGVWWMPGVK